MPGHKPCSGKSDMHVHLPLHGPVLGPGGKEGTLGRELQLKGQVAIVGSSCWPVSKLGLTSGAALCSQGASGKLLKTSVAHRLLQEPVVQTHRKHLELAQHLVSAQ